MAQSWGIALAWSRLARVSNSGNSKSRCPENPGCCLQHTLQANPHFCVPRQNPGIGMYGRLTHKVKRKGEIAIENVHMQSVWRCQNKPQPLLHDKNSNSIFALSKIFLMGMMKLPSEGVSCHQWAMDGDIQKTQFQLQALPLWGACSASFRTWKAPLGLPGDKKPLYWIKRVEKDAARCGGGGMEVVDRWRSDSSPIVQVNKKNPVFICARRGLDRILWKISSPKGLSSTGRGCSGQWWHHHSWNWF